MSQPEDHDSHVLAQFVYGNVRRSREMEIIKKVLMSDQVQNLIGAEEWDLTEEEEDILWDIIRRVSR